MLSVRFGQLHSLHPNKPRLHIPFSPTLSPRRGSGRLAARGAIWRTVVAERAYAPFDLPIHQFASFARLLVLYPQKAQFTSSLDL